jgi:ABC-type multidrug transport system ATPase subunit
MEEIIKCEGLTFAHGTLKIFNGFSFNLKKGEKLALTGSSGCGKTTFLKILAGFLPNYTGNLELFGLPLTPSTIHEIRSKIAWLPQDTAFGFETVKDALTGMFHFKVNTKSMPGDNELEELMDRLHLSRNTLGKKFTELSGGQKQRVLLGATLLSKKPLILLDEPTSALDEELKQHVTDMMLSGRTSVLASVHDPYWIGHSDRVLSLHEQQNNKINGHE